MVAMCFCFSVKKKLQQMLLQNQTLRISGNVAHWDTVQVLQVSTGHSYGVNISKEEYQR